MQELEELLKDKEKDLEKVEEQGCALVQNKTDEACAIVMETLQGVNHSWANLHHLVIPCCFSVLRMRPLLFAASSDLPVSIRPDS